MKKVLVIVLGVLGVLLTIAGVVAKAKKAVSIGVIGGADGPTSVFIAGKIGTDISVGLIVVGIILVVLTIILWIRKCGK